MNKAATPPEKTPAFSALVIIYLTVFLDLAGFGILLPALPYYAQKLGASGFGLGLLFTSYSVAQLLGASLLGRWSDRIGRRPVLLLSLLGSAVSMTLAGFSVTLLGLLVARSFAGIFGGSISAAQAFIADSTTKENRAKYMGLLGASIGAGFVFGPAMGAVLLFAGFGFSAAAFVSAGLAAANLLFALWKLPESHPAEQRGVRRVLPSWASTFGRQELAPILGCVFLNTFAFVGMESTLAYLVKARFDLDEKGFGLLLVFVGCVAIVIQGTLVGRLTRAFGEHRLATVGALMLGVSLLSLPFTPRLAWMMAALVVLAAGHGLVFPSLTTLLSKASGSEEQGSVLGVGQSLGAAARATGPVTAGLLYDLKIPLPFLLSGLLALVVAAWVGRTEPGRIRP